MFDKDKTKEQLLEEVKRCRRRIIELDKVHSEYILTQDKLMDSEKKYRTLVENVDIGITMIDANHNIIMANSMVGKWFNKSPGDFVGKKCYREFEKKEEVCSYCPGVRAMSTGQPYEIESEGIRDDGSRFTVRDKAFPLYAPEGEVIGFHEIIEDITRPKKAEKALIESENKYRSFVHNFQGIAFKGTLEFVPVFFHGAVKEITDYTEEEFTAGKPRWDKVIHPDDLPSYLSEATDKLRSVPNFSTEKVYRIIRKDGQIRWVQENIQNICDNSNQPIYVQGTIYDITERKTLEKEIKEKIKELEDFYEMAVGRELTMKQLKEEIDKLNSELSKYKK